MGTLQTSGAISFANMQTQLGGSNPISFSEYYRGGSYVPATGYGLTTIRVPAAANYYSIATAPLYYWLVTTNSLNTVTNTVVWNGTTYNIAGNGSTTSYTSSSGTYSGYTFYRGTSTFTDSDGYGNTYVYYDIYATYSGYANTDINTSVPASGKIRMSQMYGATNPNPGGVIYTPAGGGSSTTPVQLYGYSGYPGTATITISASTTVTWYWTKTGTGASSASIANGGTGTSITFNMPANALNYKYVEYAVYAYISGSTNKYWTVVLETDSDGSGGGFN